MNHHRQIRRLFGRRHAERADFLRQFRHCLRNPVLDLHLRFVHVGAQVERDRQGHHAVAGRLRKHVERTLNPVDGLLQGRRDGFRNGLGRRARVIRLDHDGRRHHFGIFADRQPEHRQQPHHEYRDGQHAGKDRPSDEKFRKIHGDKIVFRIGMVSPLFTGARFGLIAAPSVRRSPANRDAPAAGR